ncbi:MAG: glycosyltransferase family 2 protein [Cyanobacteria bacterium P01_G01_bin.67]
MSVSKDPSASIVFSTHKKNPSISIVIPTYNEVEKIEEVVNSFLTSKYPNLLEIVVVDGKSTDGTKDRLQQLAVAYPQIKVVENPQRIQSAALNIGLQACSGEFFLRADAHCDYAADYIEQCVAAFQKSEALNVGGCQRFVAKEPFQAAIAIAAQSWLGNGGAKYRDPNYSGYADTVYLGCFKRQALLELNALPSGTLGVLKEDAGKPLHAAQAFVTPHMEHSPYDGAFPPTQDVFDTTQVTNQDAELNQRLLDLDPKAIYISSKIKVWYYPRKTWKSLWTQYFKYGRGRYLTNSKHPERSQIRGKLPFLFLSTIILLLIVDIFVPSINLYMVEICIFGIMLAFLESLRVNLSLRKSFSSKIWRGHPRKRPSFLSRWFYCGIVILTMPTAHFSGYGFQAFKNRILAIKGW